MDRMGLLRLVATFLQVGAVSFGGGYSVIKTIGHYVVDVNKWLTLDEFNEIVAISQTTPGPIGINSATYVGFKVGGYLGAFLATFFGYRSSCFTFGVGIQVLLEKEGQ